MVPPQLDTELRECIAREDFDLLDKSYRSAFLILRQYLGKEWASNHVKLKVSGCPFMLNNLDGQSEDRFTHMHRVIALGDSIFGLRRSSGLNHLVQRFADRNVRPCYFEALTAASFVDDGFNIEIVRESGKRGSDFDFLATKSDEVLAVEVTVKDDIPPSEQTILNTLRGKRSQFPKDRPGILVVVIPERWTHDGQLIEPMIEAAIRQFFRDSQRINAVKIVWTSVIPMGEGRVSAEVFRPFIHPHPRLPITNYRFLAPSHLGDFHHFHAVLKQHSKEVLQSLEGDPQYYMSRFWQHYLAQLPR